MITLRGSNLNLAADAAGPTDAPTLLFLHGSGQTRQSWAGALAEAVQRGYRAISVDLRGHGDSEWSPDGEYSLDTFARDIRQVIEQLDDEPIVVGASLGGLIGMMVAAAPPPRLRGLVLVDITARVEMSGANEVIAFMDSAPDGFASLEEAAAAVAAYLPHRPPPKNTNGLKRNLRLRNGRYYWHWDPAFIRMGRDSQGKLKTDGPNPLETFARAIDVPTLLVRGSRSRIVSEEGAREFLEMVPHAEFVDIAGAHHMVAGDANDAFNEAVFDFIDRQVGQQVGS
ncbi:alpha/beta fold hydrolase [Steroidobacter flavus]|uniref:Alpha/beta fold hydrolase n=1 Tax=Steroidobacter flavus TaxID=1842136 RepID=A0ABV8T4A3_9GAMM